MFDLDNWQEIFDTIRRHKLRTFLTALSVWWGIFMLVVLLGSGSGLRNSFEHNFRDDALNSIWVYRGQTSISYQGLPAGRYLQFSNDDYDMLRNEVEGIDKLTGRYYLTGEYVVNYQDKSLSFDVRTVHPDHLFLENTLMTEGRFINDKDIREIRKVCVLGDLIVEDLFEEGADPVGEYVQVKGVEYQVVGVFTDEGGENERRRIYLPITTAQRIDSGTERIHQLMFTVSDPTLEGSKKVEEQVRQHMASLHQFDPKDDQALYINNNLQEYQQFQTVFNMIDGFLWFVGIGSIIAGVIGVSNIMLIVVKERTREIGVRKALGATPRSIIGMILLESVFLTGMAGYIGLLSGFGVVYGINALMKANDVELEFFYNPEVSFGAVIIALIILVVCGALAGLIPALQAAKVQPIEAMKQ
ncbi:MAG: ABC transporter permease [Saprospiraceae bacterium]|nr:ABC transporter permease [Saprospiraceae bacterium]